MRLHLVNTSVSPSVGLACAVIAVRDVPVDFIALQRRFIKGLAGSGLH